MPRHCPRPHYKRCRGEIDPRFGRRVGLHVVLIDGDLRTIKCAIVAIELSECVHSIRGTQDHAIEDAGRRRTAWAFGRGTPEYWRASRSPIQGAGQVRYLVLNAIWKSGAVAHDE